MNPLTGQCNIISVDNAYSLGPDKYFLSTSTISPVSYAIVEPQATAGNDMINKMDQVNYSGNINDSETNTNNVAEQLDSIKGSGIGYRPSYSRYIIKQNKKMRGSGKTEPGIPIHKKSQIDHNKKNKHILAHDPAHRLRSWHMDIKTQN